MQTKVSQTYKPTVRLTGKRGWYCVQSGTTPGVYYETSAHSCRPGVTERDTGGKVGASPCAK